MEIIKGGRTGERGRMVIPLVPKVGDIIYVPNSIHAFSSEEPDTLGGRAQVLVVKPGISGGKTVNFVEVDALPGHSLNWDQYLRGKQAALEERFQDRWARPDWRGNPYSEPPGPGEGWHS